MHGLWIIRGQTLVICLGGYALPLCCDSLLTTFYT